jgi:hypothetical protein
LISAHVLITAVGQITHLLVLKTNLRCENKLACGMANSRFALTVLSHAVLDVATGRDTRGRCLPACGRRWTTRGCNQRPSPNSTRCEHESRTHLAQSGRNWMLTTEIHRYRRDLLIREVAPSAMATPVRRAIASGSAVPWNPTEHQLFARDQQSVRRVSLPGTTQHDGLSRVRAVLCHPQVRPRSSWR